MGAGWQIQEHSNERWQWAKGVDVQDVRGEEIGQVAEVRDDVFIVTQGLLSPTRITISYEEIATFDHVTIHLKFARDQLQPVNWQMYGEEGSVASEFQ